MCMCVLCVCVRVCVCARVCVCVCVWVCFSFLFLYSFLFCSIISFSFLFFYLIFVYCLCFSLFVSYVSFLCFCPSFLFPLLHTEKLVMTTMMMLTHDNQNLDADEDDELETHTARVHKPCVLILKYWFRIHLQSHCTDCLIPCCGDQDQARLYMCFVLFCVIFHFFTWKFV